AMSLFLLSIAALLYLVPGVMDGHSRLVVLLVKIGWAGIVCVAILLPMQSLRECVIITDDGLVKLNLLGRETRMAWRDISDFQIKPDDNKVILRSMEKNPQNEFSLFEPVNPQSPNSLPRPVGR